MGGIKCTRSARSLAEELNICTFLSAITSNFLTHKIPVFLLLGLNESNQCNFQQLDLDLDLDLDLNLLNYLNLNLVDNWERVPLGVATSNAMTK